MEEVLIAAVFKRVPLWNASHKYHKNVPILIKLWEEVAQEVNKDDNIVRKKWKNLRAYFFRELRKLDEGGDDSISTWKFFKQMMFLIDEVTESQKFSTIDIESSISDGSELPESSDKFNLEGTISDLPGRASSTKSKLTCKIEKQSESSHNDRHDELLHLEKRKINLLERDIHEQNDDLLFFRSLLPYMSRIPLRKKLKLRSAIQDAILEQLPLDNNEIPELIEAVPDLESFSRGEEPAGSLPPQIVVK